MFETAKDPAFILSSVNTVLIIGGGIHVNNRLDVIEKNLESINSSLSEVVNRLNNLEKKDKENTQDIDNIERLVSRTTTTISLVQDDVNDIINTLEDSGMEVQHTEHTRRSGNRRETQNIYRGRTDPRNNPRSAPKPRNKIVREQVIPDIQEDHESYDDDQELLESYKDDNS